MPKCELEDCFHEIRVSIKEWRSLLSNAANLDLDNGSYYDARGGAINFWCGPDNKPKNWPGEIDKGALKYPREFVGLLLADNFKKRSVVLHFQIASYQRAEVAGLKPGSPAFLKKLRGTKGDRKWVLAQFELLRDHARLMETGQ